MVGVSEIVGVGVAVALGNTADGSGRVGVPGIGETGVCSSK